MKRSSVLQSSVPLAVALYCLLPGFAKRVSAAEGVLSVEQSTGVAAEHEAFFKNSVLPILQANCFKCHRFLKEGEGVGPDLTTVRRDLAYE